METMIAYVDDAEYALKMLPPLMPAVHAQMSNQTTHWVIVACAPGVMNDVGKWVSAEAKGLWRDDWAQAVFDQIKPLVGTMGNTVTTQLANQNSTLIEQTNTLLAQYNNARVIDARRPKFGQNLEPITSTQRLDKTKFAGLAAAVTVATVLAADF